MNFLILIVCVFILRRVWNRRRPTGCNYQPHERAHSDTLINLAAREVRDLRRELKDAGVIR